MIVLISPEKILKNEVEVLNEMFQNGLQTFHLRKYKTPRGKVENFLLGINPKFLNRVVLHHHHELVEEYQLKGYHFNEKNRASYTNRYSSNKSCSTSFHTVKDLEKESHHFSYSFLSPVYNSISKKGYKGQAFKLESKHKNVIGLGGVEVSKLDDLKRRGFSGAAVLGAVWNNPSPVDKIQEFLSYKW